jgi:hypothetical protein
MLFGAAKECVELMFGSLLRTSQSFDPNLDSSLREAAMEMVLRYWHTVSLSFPDLWSDIDSMPTPGHKKTKEKPGSSGFRYRLLEETGIRAFSKLGEKLFVAAWIPSLRSPSWEVVEAALGRLGQSSHVRLVLTKPRRNPSVLEVDPYLVSSGKAGVEALYRHLEAELLSFLGPLTTRK